MVQVPFEFVFFIVLALLGETEVRALSCHRSSIYEIKGDKVYYGKNLVEGAEPKSFKPHTPYRPGGAMQCPSYQSFASDSQNIYFAGKKFHQADVPTFQVINEIAGVAQDKDTFYCRLVARPRSGSVQLMTAGYYKDQSSVCYLGTFLSDRDAASFVVLGESGVIYSKDKNYVYCDDSVLMKGKLAILKGADTQSFELFRTDKHSGVTAKDKAETYVGCKALPVGTLRSGDVANLDRLPYHGDQGQNSRNDGQPKEFYRGEIVLQIQNEFTPGPFAYPNLGPLRNFQDVRSRAKLASRASDLRIRSKARAVTNLSQIRNRKPNVFCRFVISVCIDDKDRLVETILGRRLPDDVTGFCR